MSLAPTVTSRDGREQSDSFRCRTCGRGFSRNEHLRRHELIHSDSKPFQCTICRREFVRKDALDRHVAIHQDSGPSLRQKGARACSNCASSKVKCSGELPMCSRCESRGETQCTYPHAQVSSTAVRAQSARQLSVLSPAMTATSRQIRGLDQDVSSNGFTTPAAHGADPVVNSPLVQDLPFDQAYWEHDFETTINWLPEENHAFTNDLSLGSLDGEAFFPFFGALGEINTAIESPLQPAPAALAGAGTTNAQDSRYFTISPQQTVETELSPGMTSLSAGESSCRQPHTEGELYVDGQPARLPRVKRRKLTMTNSTTTPQPIDVYDFTIVDESLLDNGLDSKFVLNDRVYDHLCDAFSKVCRPPQHDIAPVVRLPGEEPPFHPASAFAASFESSFPSKSVFESLVYVYMSSFNPLLPIFHTTSCRDLDWQVVLAISALGCRSGDRAGSNAELAASLHEFLRRVIYLAEEDDSWLPESSAARAQIRLLLTISATYAFSRRSHTNKDPTRHLPIDFCLDSWTVSSPVPAQATGVSSEWTKWKTVEARNRLGFAIWLVDIMLAIHSQRRPRLSLRDPLPSLPCHEELWHAESAEEWLRCRSKYPSAGFMKDAMYEIYVQKRLAQNMGEFSRVLLIHGLFHRMWEVEAQFNQPLSQWTPTARKPTDQASLRESPVWLPSIPTFARWRNATCDCIDILHWSANATIGAASGMEHPTVLHLHFSRVVLLTPYESIVSIAKYVAGVDCNKQDTRVVADKQAVRRWAVQDQYKARLAMIHAGVLFWHVRRYSVSGFYEPTSVAMAALALWAFSGFTERRQNSKSGSPNITNVDVNLSFSEGEEPRCDIILLDRPTDDELVQQYVKEGHQMRAIMKGVGDLCGPHAAERVLIEGRKLLRTLLMWGISEYWVSIFDKLIAASSHQRQALGTVEN